MNTNILQYWKIVWFALLLSLVVMPCSGFAKGVGRSSFQGVSESISGMKLQTNALVSSGTNETRDKNVNSNTKKPLLLSLSDIGGGNMDKSFGDETPPETAKPDYEGLRKDCYYFLGYQFLVVGVLYLSPQSVSSWTPEQKKDFTIQKYYNHVTDIVWDHDKLYINYLLHPYWGMSYYVRARERGVSETGAFGYAFLLSSFWEFGIEAMFEEASIQDLFITPIVGSVVGKYVDSYREGIKQKPEKSGMDKIMLGVTDPLGALNHWVEGNIGKQASVSFSYSAIQPSYTQSAQAGSLGWQHYQLEQPFKFSPRFGLTFRYSL